MSVHDIVLSVSLLVVIFLLISIYVSARNRDKKAVADLRLRDRAMTASQNGIIITDPHQDDNPVIYVNPAFEKITGYSSDEAIGKNCRFLQGPGTDPLVRREIHNAIASNSQYTGVILNYRKNGRTFWNELRISPVFDNAGRLQNFVAVQSDVTEKINSENMLALQYAFARASAESTSLSDTITKVLRSICERLQWEVGTIWRIDRDHNILRCTDFWHSSLVEVSGFEQMTRNRSFRPGDGLPGRVWSTGEPIWISDITKDANFPRADIAAKEGLHAAFAFPMHVGKEIMGAIELFSRLPKEPDKFLLYVMGAMSSQIGQLMQRKRAEQQFRVILESAPCGMVIVNRDRKIVMANSRMAELFGYDRDEMIGKDIGILVPERYRSQHRHYEGEFFEKPVARPMGAGRDLSGVHKDGREFPIEIGLNPIETEEGLMILSTIVDISERKRVEEARLKSRDTASS